MDERLRKLEAAAARGDPDAARKLVAERLRAEAQEGQWEQFDYLFDLIEQRPWDGGLVAQMIALCNRMPSHTIHQLNLTDEQPDAPPPITERVVIADGQHSITPNHITRMVIRGGQFRERPANLSATNNQTLANCRKVFICGGTFDSLVLQGSEHVIIAGGTFGALGDIENLTIIDGTFKSVNAKQYTLIIGGTIGLLSPGVGTIVVGGNVNTVMWPTYANALIWLPRLQLGQTRTPFNSKVLARSLEIGWFHNDSWETQPSNSPGAIYVADCPLLPIPEGQQMPYLLNITHIIPRQHIYEQLPLLRADKRINRSNLKPWLTAQFERLQSIAVPWAKQRA